VVRVTSAASWPLPNGDAQGTRNAGNSSLRTTNVARLRRLWRFAIPEPPTYSGLLASTPLIVGDAVYVQTLHSNLYALDAQTGRVLWKHRFAATSGGPNGLAARDDVLFGVEGSSVFAVDRATGHLRWIRRVSAPSAPLTVAPAVAGSLVVVGTSPQRPSGRGSVIALRASSGEVAWRRGTILRPWARPKLASGGGVWWTPTFGSGGLWVGTGNPLPWGGTAALPNGGAYEGRALYTDSLLELDAPNGQIRWSDQVTPHDVRDYDFSLPPILDRAGNRSLVIGSGKAGRVVAWDVLSRTRAWTAVVGRHARDTGPLPARAVDVCPGLYGGVLTPMAAASGRIFVPVVDLCMRGSATGYEPLAGVDAADRGRGELVALSARSGRVLWTHRLSSPPFGCATAAGDVVLTTTYGGTVLALSQSTGRVLWQAREPAGINGCPAVAGRLVVVPAGAEPSTISTPTPVVDAYSIRD
jgi:outer membrane protein assembly factor BamB